MNNVKLFNMCMIYDNDNILVQERVKQDWPGITFPGGKIENNESIVESVIREVKEETNLDISNVEICGVKDWINEGTRYLILFFKTNTFKGTLKDSHEGKVFWINKNDLKNYKLASEFDKMYEVFINPNLTEFYFDKQEDGSWQSKFF